MIKFVDLVYPIRIFRRLCYELRNKPIFFARWIVLSPEKMLRSHLSKFIIRSVQFTKIVETRRDTGAEKIPFRPRKVRPAIFGQKRFVTPPPNYTFHPLQRFHLSFFFPFLLRISPVLLSLSLSPSSSSSASALFCPSRPSSASASPPDGAKYETGETANL